MERPSAVTIGDQSLGNSGLLHEDQPGIRDFQMSISLDGTAPLVNIPIQEAGRSNILQIVETNGSVNLSTGKNIRANRRWRRNPRNENRIRVNNILRAWSTLLEANGFGSSWMRVKRRRWMAC